VVKEHILLQFPILPAHGSQYPRYVLVEWQERGDSGRIVKRLFDVEDVDERTSDGQADRRRRDDRLREGRQEGRRKRNDLPAYETQKRARQRSA